MGKANVQDWWSVFFLPFSVLCGGGLQLQEIKLFSGDKFHFKRSDCALALVAYHCSMMFHAFLLFLSFSLILLILSLPIWHLLSEALAAGSSRRMLPSDGTRTH